MMKGSTLAQIRRSKHLTQAQVGLSAGLHKDTVRKWESKSYIELPHPTAFRILAAIEELSPVSSFKAEPTRKSKQFAGICQQVRMRAHVRHGVLDVQQKKRVDKINGGICGAKTRIGSSCKCRVLINGGRCKLHGGLSTGPKTIEGRQRISYAQRTRWQVSFSQANIRN